LASSIVEEPTMSNEIIPSDTTAASRALAQPHALVDAGHGRLAYWRFGRGPDVVLVHGWPLHAATFRHLGPRLAPRFTLHLFDLPGAGRSEWQGSLALPAMATALRAAIDRLALGRYTLVAHDSGAVFARLVAADDARVDGLIMGNTEVPGHRSRVVELYVWAARHPRLAALMLASMRWRWLRRSGLGFGGCFADPAFVDGEFGDWFVRPMLATPALGLRAFDMLRELDLGLIDRLAAVHARIAAPVLCIWGSDDPFFPVAKARRMLPEFPGGAPWPRSPAPSCCRTKITRRRSPRSPCPSSSAAAAPAAPATAWAPRHARPRPPDRSRRGTAAFRVTDSG
jgi:pimeloyl-ACP methyl ester carboxylesterase